MPDRSTAYPRCLWCLLVLLLLAALVLTTIAPAAAELASPVLRAPGNGATGVTRPVLLYWSVVDGALNYHVQVATDEAFTNVVWHQLCEHPTHQALATGLASGTKYYWRVVASDGTDTAHSEVWTFTTAEETITLAAPVLRTPENGATGVITNPRLTWNAVDNATGYWVQVATTDGFQTLVWNRAHTETVAAVSGLHANTQYWWRVRALREGTHGPWSSVWSFTTGERTGLPAAPVLLSPSNGATGVSVSPHLQWQGVDGAKYYCLQVSTTDGFSTTVWSRAYLAPQTIAELNGLQPNTRYFWRVLARNEIGSSPWSTVWSFTTAGIGPPSTAPHLLAPANRATGVSVTPRLSWTSVERATAYKLQVSTNESFTSLVWNRSTTATYAEISGLHANTRYWWRVAAGNNSGLGPWSTVWCFNTISVVAPSVAPTLLSPTNRATGLGISPRLYWTAVERATMYKLLVATDEGFNTIVISKYVPGTSETVSLQPNTRYWWKVEALNEGGRGPWSVIWSFTTGGGLPPAAPVLISPEDGATGVSTAPRLSWSPVDGAGGYWLQVSRNDSFTGLVWSKSYHDTVAEITGLNPGVHYYWRVIAANENGFGPWSDVWDFVTAH